MKKNLYTLVTLSLVLSPTFANANQGQITLLGSVTAATCNIEVSTAGRTDSVIQLGEVSVGASGDEIGFTLAPAADSPCAALDGTTGKELKAADVTWASATLTNAGIENASGTSTNVIAKLTAKPSTGDALITSANPTTSFSEAESSGGSAGMDFTAQLDATNASATAGTYRAVVSYSVAYK